MGVEKKIGRPPKFENPKELQKKIEQYISESIENTEPLTISGLCFYCGFESRQSFYAYEKKDEFSYTIKRARLIIENTYELLLHDKYPTGAIFALKNLGWADEHHISHNISYSDISDAELIDRANKLLNPGKKN